MAPACSKFLLLRGVLLMAPGTFLVTSCFTVEVSQVCVNVSDVSAKRGVGCPAFPGYNPQVPTEHPVSLAVALLTGVLSHHWFNEKSGHSL